MAVGLASAQAAGILDALGNATNYTAPTAFWLQLHTADPGSAGTTAATSLSFTATANGFAGTPPVTGQAAGTYTFASTAAGIDRALGVATTSLTFSSTAAGIDRTLGATVAPFTVTTTAIGARKTFAQAAASLAFSATGSGFVGVCHE